MWKSSILEITGDLNPSKSRIVANCAIAASLLMFWMAFKLRTPNEPHLYISNDSNWHFFRLQHLSIVWDLLNQTDSHRDFSKPLVDLSFEGRLSTLLAYFNFVSTRYEWLKRQGQRTAHKVHALSNIFCLLFSHTTGNRCQNQYPLWSVSRTPIEIFENWTFTPSYMRSTEINRLTVTINNYKFKIQFLDRCPWNRCSTWMFQQRC